MNKDIEKLFSFIVEIDKMKTIYRQTYILAEDRQETDAEHSWHMAIMVPLLSKYSNEPIDEGHTIKLCLAHDLVEIYAGDTYCYDAKASEDKEDREKASAEKLFSMLDEPLKTEIHSLWLELSGRFEIQPVPGQQPYRVRGKYGFFLRLYFWYYLFCGLDSLRRHLPGFSADAGLSARPGSGRHGYAAVLLSGSGHSLPVQRGAH